MTKSELNQEWEERIAAFRASGQTLVAWCAQENIKLTQAKYWVKKFKHKETSISSPKWLAVDRELIQSAQTEKPLVVKVGPAAIEVYPGFNKTLFQDIVQALHTSC